MIYNSVGKDAFISLFTGLINVISTQKAIHSNFICHKCKNIAISKTFFFTINNSQRLHLHSNNSN